MELVQETLPELSQYVAGLLLASLVVFAVLLIGLILFRKGRKKQTSDTEAVSSAAKGSENPSTPAAQSSQTAESAETQTAKDAKNVVKLVPEEEDHAERALRFQKLAYDALEEGRLGEATSLFRKTLAVSTNNDMDEISAGARYELGNLAKANNDLLSACENWQIARTLYEQLGEKKKVRELDNIMTDAQCPSDWVLNKF